MTDTSKADDRDPFERLGERLFTMVVYTDTHLNQGETECASPHQVNRLSNARMRYVVNRINAVEPDFVIHLGDLVHPVPSLPAYADAARRFLEQSSLLTCTQYLCPGNHDVGDKPIKWGPAGVVCDDFLALWERHFGAQFYAFDHKGCHFVVLNAQIINSGLAAEAAQKAWLEQDLAANAGRRMFFNIHYPPFLTEPDEAEHYDDIAEPGRSWLLGLLERYRVEALFAGHVHNFWYNRYRDTHCYVLPSTAFVRQDYSEMYRIQPGPEAGRNDPPKLGYVVVHIHESGHVCHPVRTFGRTVEADAPMPPVPHRVGRLHSIENRRAAMGFDLRQSWAELVEIPPSGGLDEFARKRVRNDYPLMALWEMGVRKLRVPLGDLADARIRRRMADLRAFGHGFTVFSFEPPTGALRDALIAHADLVDAWEVGFAWHELEGICAGVRAIKEAADVPVYLSKLRSKEDLESDGHRYYHVINHGFVAGESEAIRSVLEGAGASLVDGFVFRIVRPQPCWPEIIAVGELAAALDIDASVHVRIGAQSPADACEDDAANANRIAECLAAALTQPRVTAFVDTFADVDRGYFVRTGVVDRRYNPRLASHVVGNLYAALNADLRPLRPGPAGHGPEGRTVVVIADQAVHLLALPDATMTLETVALPADVAQEAGEAACVDLESGIRSALPWRRRGDGEAVVLERALRVTVPTLLTIEGRFGGAA